MQGAPGLGGLRPRAGRVEPPYGHWETVPDDPTLPARTPTSLPRRGVGLVAPGSVVLLTCAWRALVCWAIRDNERDPEL